jgi:hypothetical protein
MIQFIGHIIGTDYNDERASSRPPFGEVVFMLHRNAHPIHFMGDM